MFDKDKFIFMDFEKLRENLVHIVMSKGISDQRVLDALRKVERHKFIPRAYWNEAYEDYPLPIGEGQTISQPYTVAFMTELLDVEPGNKVLEVGTGSGYQAAILAELGADVYTVERIYTLYEKTKKLLKELGYDSVKVLYGDGTEGLPEFAPFDRIIVTASGPLQQQLLDQLAVQGILVAPVDDKPYGSTMVRLTKVSDKDYITERYGGFSFVPLVKGTR